MILFDTDHLSILRMPTSLRRTRLVEKMALSLEKRFCIPVIAVEETMRGWLAAIAKERFVQRQVLAYRELSGLFGFFAGFTIAEFTGEAATRFDDLRKHRVRIASKDLKIASTALVLDAKLLTANRRDFEKVPGLKFENWLD